VADLTPSGLTPIAANAFTAPDDVGRIRLIGQRCEHCGASFFPGARTNCIQCYGTELKAVELTSTGTVDCFTIVRQAPKGYYGPVPYVIGSVTLDSEAQVIAQLVGKDPETWHYGEVVTACALELPRERDGTSVALCYAFRPAEEMSHAQSLAPERDR